MLDVATVSLNKRNILSIPERVSVRIHFIYFLTNIYSTVTTDEDIRNRDPIMLNLV